MMCFMVQKLYSDIPVGKSTPECLFPVIESRYCGGIFFDVSSLLSAPSVTCFISLIFNHNKRLIMLESRNQEGQRETGQKSRRGFAAMNPDRQKQIASEGGRAAHRQGVAHEWNADEARQAGRKGGQNSKGTRNRNGSDRNES
jgi:general stress protein YciG